MLLLSFSRFVSTCPQAWSKSWPAPHTASPSTWSALIKKDVYYVGRLRCTLNLVRGCCRRRCTPDTTPPSSSAPSPSCYQAGGTGSCHTSGTTSSSPGARSWFIISATLLFWNLHGQVMSRMDELHESMQCGLQVVYTTPTRLLHLLNG